MGQIKINTDKAALAAQNMSMINNRIRSGFTNVERAVKALDSSWVSGCAVNAMNVFNSIKHSYNDARFKVMNDYVIFLYQQIDEGYAQTETVNKSLSDAFK